MPLQLLPLQASDALSWTRIRSAAYKGPTNTLIHTTLPVSKGSVHRVAQDRAKEIGKPNTWHWKIIDTDLPPSADDPQENRGRTIAIAVWSAHNLELDRDARRKDKEADKSIGKDGSNEPTTNPAEIDKPDEKQEPLFLPPELKIDVLMALLNPLRDAQKEIMGENKPYFMLNSLATHPDHHRRGCATLLLEWGIKKADDLGVEMYLDSSRMARPLYEKWGFELVRGVEFDRTVWGGEGIDWHGCMVRKART